MVGGLPDQAVFFPSRRRHTRFDCDWSSDVCSSDLRPAPTACICALLFQRRCRGLGNIGSLVLGSVSERVVHKCTRSVLVVKGERLEGPEWRSEERRVGKEGRSRWSPYH